jgi:enterochelin esterase-like enzyme
MNRALRLLDLVLLALVGSRLPAQLLDGPQVDADRKVTFRLKAPEAKSVQLDTLGGDLAPGKGPFPLERGADGGWTATIGPARPGFHYYALLVDGVAVNDPASEVYFGWGRWTSGVEVPDPAFDLSAAPDLPRGEVRERRYHSRLTGRERRMMVHVPPGYQAGTDRYPVLYLQHGAGESELAWSQQGKAGLILDRLIAEKKARPFLLIMENDYAAPPGAKQRKPWAEDPENNFEAVLLEEVIPMVDRDLRTIADRDHRALAGLSMGSFQALKIGLRHPETFGSVAAMSCGSRQGPEGLLAPLVADAAAGRAPFKLLWIGCGRQDGLFARSEALHAALEKAGIPHVWHPGEGTHEWGTWREHLRDLAPLLFRG